MEDRIRELETQVMSLSFINELLMDKVGISTEEIQNFAKKCLENLDDNEKNTDNYYLLMGFAYHEKAAEMIKKEAASLNCIEDKS